MKNVQLTRSRHIVLYANLLTKAGEPLGRILNMAGLPSNCLDNPRTLVPTSALWRFRDLAAYRTDLPNVTMDVVADLDFGALGPISDVVLREPTLIKMVRAFDQLVKAESSTPSIDVQPCADGGVLFVERLAMRQVQGKWQAELYILLWMLKIVQLVEPSWAPTEISCISEASPDRVQAIESLGAKPLFNQSRTAFKIPASMLALPYKGQRCKPDSPSSEENDRWLSDPSDTLAGSVKQVIRAYSGDRWLSALEVSEVAGTSLRTLQRRLSLESTSFSVLLEEVRGELAVDLLENTDASISEIAAHLGYEDQANFSRAFSRWAGVPPTLFRSQRGARQE